MAWTSNSFNVNMQPKSGSASAPAVSEDVRARMKELADRADSYAHTRKLRVDSIQDPNLRESVKK